MASLKTRPASPKCKCCPYGFHIDLDFVKFAENIANGNTVKQNGDARSYKRIVKHCTTNGAIPSSSSNNGNISNMNNNNSINCRNVMSPLESIFSDSLENIVSDFEEALNPRDYASDRETFGKGLNYGQRNGNAGYASDYGPHRSSARTSSVQYGSYTTVKPPVANVPGSPQGYCTALGKTISEIKARHDWGSGDKKLPPPRPNFVSYRKNDEHAPKNELHVLSSQKVEKVQYNDNGTSLFSRQSEESARQNCLVGTYQNEIDRPVLARQSLVQRSASAAEMSGFNAERKRNFEGDGRTSALSHPERNRSFTNSLASYSMLPSQSDTEPSYFRYYGIKTPLGLQNFYREDAHCVSAKREKSMPDDYCKGVSSVGTSTAPLPPTKPCSECSVLREKLIELSGRLASAEKEKLLNTTKDNVYERSAAVCNISAKPLQKHFVDKRVGNSAVAGIDVAVSTVSVQCCDFAGDAYKLDYKDRDASVEMFDRACCGQVQHKSVSPMPKPICISFGTVTDLNLTNSTISTEDMVGETAVRECFEKGCVTDSPIYKNVSCEVINMILKKDEGTSTEQPIISVISRSVGDLQAVALEDQICEAVTNVEKLSRESQTETATKKSVGLITTAICMEERGVNPVAQLMQDACTSCDVVLEVLTSEVHSQTEQYDLEDSHNHFNEVETQTDFEYDHLEPRILSDSEIAESLWLMPSKDTVEAAVGNDDDYAFEIDKAQDISKASEREDMLKTGKVGSKSVEESFEKRQETDVDSTNRPRTLGQQRAAIVRKLLTETKIPQPNGNFVRGCASSRSCRMETRKGDSLQYITDQYAMQNISTPSTPQTQKGALKEKVVLKKEPIAFPSKVPDPIPARIPRPKISRYSPVEAQAQSPDEEAEIADRLTPLRSEMRTLRTFSSSRVIPNSRPMQSADNVYDAGGAEEDTTSSDSEGSYDTNEIVNTTSPPSFNMSKQLREALEILKHKFDHIPVENGALDWATKYVQHEWLKTAARRTALAQQVEGYIEALKNCSDKVLLFVVNLTDQNENTALHYAVSHGNFDVVSVILDSGVCQLDKANKAGYTAVMLAALCDINDEIESAVIKRLFQMGNVNTKAAQHGQTALMLAVSHGKINTTRLLLHCGADLNMQDEEGSTALMCAAEHGHKDIVKLLLAQPGIDASISDCDSSTALSIAVENRHRDIGVLIYAHLNYARNEQTHHDSLTTVH